MRRKFFLDGSLFNLIVFLQSCYFSLNLQKRKRGSESERRARSIVLIQIIAIIIEIFTQLDMLIYVTFMYANFLHFTFFNPLVTKAKSAIFLPLKVIFDNVFGMGKASYLAVC